MLDVVNQWTCGSDKVRRSKEQVKKVRYFTWSSLKFKITYSIKVSLQNCWLKHWVKYFLIVSKRSALLLATFSSLRGLNHEVGGHVLGRDPAMLHCKHAHVWLATTCSHWCQSHAHMCGWQPYVLIDVCHMLTSMSVTCWQHSKLHAFLVCTFSGKESWITPSSFTSKHSPQVVLAHCTWVRATCHSVSQ